TTVPLPECPIALPDSGPFRMRHALISSVLLLPLLTGCLPSEDPLAPELKGRWAAPNANKLRAALLADRGVKPAPTPASTNDDTHCRDQYVMFNRKRGITLHINQQVKPLFAVSEIKREGARFIFTGKAPVFGAEQSKIEIVLRNGEVRFDDIVDQT